MNILLNGQPQTLSAPSTLNDLISTLPSPALKYGVAVSLNDEIIPKTEWSQILLKDNDILEIVQATQGG